jgi:acetyl-CoA carboxylase carboxyl transferase subunit beta
MVWFRRRPQRAPDPEALPQLQVPEGLYHKCEQCAEIIYSKELERNAGVCPKCAFHFRLRADDFIGVLFDAGSFTEHDTGLEPEDPLRFKDSKPYPARLKAARKANDRADAMVSGTGTIDGLPVAAAVFEFGFMGGSMGSVVGEKVTRTFERALERRCAALVLSASGGARMQEGIFSLMQMAKTTLALSRLREAGLPYVSVLTHPTTGGVAASFAMLGDVILAEPGALIGFAGPRVIETTIRATLPEGFQRAEFLLAHGFVDRVVDRRQMKREVAAVVRMLTQKQW